MSGTALTFAELQFVISLVPDSPIDVVAQLELDPEHASALLASGLASLLVREACDVGQDGVELRGDVAEITESFGAAVECYRISITTETDMKVWQIFASNSRRMLVTPLGYGVFQCMPMQIEPRLDLQLGDLLEASLDDDSHSIILEKMGRDSSTGVILERSASDWIDRDHADAPLSLRDHLISVTM